MRSDKETARRVLSDAQREQFVQNGFVKLENAFSSETAAEARAILWPAVGCDPEDRNTWTRPVVRLGDFAQEPFRQAVNTVTLHAAFDELVGPSHWVPRQSLGGFPVRFPHPDDPGDTGWHVDASFPPDRPAESDGTYFDWRVNLRSKGRALLMLFLFSDVGENDAPTRIRLGSHLRVPQLLAPAGEEGLSAMEIGIAAARATTGMPEATATGAAGTVFLCHPFLVHAAQRHRGLTPRFLAQPPLIPRVPFDLTRSDGQYSLVEKAILLGLRRPA
ncbi:MAG TPA: phytanoyl-CoA dioxygenase family protein [Edaphobacter sp.]